ncbi:MAG: transcriptional regulator [Armatimonadetes bacterium]|nr:transcriptional regulator [Armatimonadota bacterium]
MHSTRKEILGLLKKRGPMTVRELSESLGITPMGVRQHLATLERDAYVAVEGVRRGQGRPSRIYAITPEGDDLFPRTYQQFTVAILDSLQTLAGEDQVARVLDLCKDRNLESYRQRMEGKGFSEKIIELARIRDEEGYVAEWKQVDPETFLLIEHNCPIRFVAGRFQQACRCELDLFAEVLGAEVERTHHIVNGEPYCCYVIRRRQEAGRPQK